MFDNLARRQKKKNKSSLSPANLSRSCQTLPDAVLSVTEHSSGPELHVPADDVRLNPLDNTFHLS